MDSYDLVVVGAGWFGLSAAKTYLELHSSENILILDMASSFGGTWSKDRLYPGLKSNNLWGSYEHPDFPMSEKLYGIRHGQHIPAEIMHLYLTDFAKQFGLYERTQLNTAVEEVQPESAGGWQLAISTVGTKKTIHAKRLVIATGLTSQPNLPKYAGEETFTGRKFHAKDFCVNGETTKSAKRAVVVGCGKSAYDCTYAYAAEGGANVDLIVRPAGQGPVWLCPPYVTPFKRMLEELLHTRGLTWFSPTPWGSEDGYGAPREWLHRTALGNFITSNYWNMMSNEVIEAHGFDNHSELFKLKPWYPAFWTGSGVGIHNFESSLYDLVRQGKVHVHVADIEKLDGDQVHLSNGTTLAADVLVCATGWKKSSSIKYNNFGPAGLGLTQSAEDQERLRREADREVLDRFPILKNQPVLRYERSKEEPLRYYRFIVPPSQFSKRNIAFAGMVSTVSTASFANAQALWISAFFDGKLKRVPKDDEEMAKEVMLHTQFGKWRYPCGYGDSLPDFSFDSLPYIDLLLNDVGVRNHRKESPIAEITEPYKPKDYKGLTQEFLDLHAKA
ncbi:hypothetical protein DL765_006551 [Monosporascus sp. GIB2]|nr:hypothetical protein DL765_006551 [Monosporascus sp. GIB2]